MVSASYEAYVAAVYSISSMIRVLGTILAGLLGLAFGSFLNVCLSRWPEGESIVHPHSHCRSCGRALAWWENVPIVSWLVLRGHCRTCDASISWRYPLVELAVGGLWALETWHCFHPELLSTPNTIFDGFWFIFLHGVSQMVLFWMLLALAVLDAEHFWLPDWITWIGIATGVLARLLFIAPLMHINDLTYRDLPEFDPLNLLSPWFSPLLAALIAAGLILLIRWIYWLIRRREGVGLGDAKLMAMLAAWLGLEGALLSFVIGVVLGAVVAIVLLVSPSVRRDQERWAQTKLPLGTFLCVGGIVSALWGEPIIHAYLRWAGF